jgi:alpha-galactosidase
VGWGYQLVKHDFSTFDHFGRWGPEMGRQLTDAGWAPADRSVTNAEVLLGLYRTIREAAGEALVLGCNTVGHLAAGLVDVQRTGDDSSGKFWERTRRMSVNTLAFRLPQHGSFFSLDADCVPCTRSTPWERNRELLDLVARSGTALFVSVDPRCRDRAVDADLRAALRTALDGGEPGGVEPLDWLTTTSPRDWRVGPGRRRYRWLGPYGAGERLDGPELTAL